MEIEGTELGKIIIIILSYYIIEGGG